MGKGKSTGTDGKYGKRYERRVKTDEKSEGIRGSVYERALLV